MRTTAAAAEAADTVAAAVRAVPGVAGLHGGTWGEAATLLPGRRVVGVRLAGDRTVVHLVAEPGTDLNDLARRVQTAVRATRTGEVDVVVEDIADRAVGGDLPDTAAPYP